MEVAGLGPVTEAGASQTRSVKGLTENKARSVSLLSPGDVSLHLAPVSAVRGAEMTGAVCWDEK